MPQWSVVSARAAFLISRRMPSLALEQRGEQHGCDLLRSATVGKSTLPARRPSAGACRAGEEPCLAARTHRPFALLVSVPWVIHLRSAGLDVASEEVIAWAIRRAAASRWPPASG